MITIKFEAEDSELLQEFHRFIYNADPNMVIDEHYEMSIGVQKEPVVSALIARIAGAPMLKTIKDIHKNWMDFKKEKLKQQTQQKLHDQQHTERLLKMYLSAGEKWQELDLDDFDRLRL